MSRRKGELSPAGIDRGWPHQIALHEDLCTGWQFDEHYAFNQGRSICSRGRTVIRRQDPRTGCAELYRLFCFADPVDAAAFLERFGGEAFDPARSRGRGARREFWV